MWEEIISERQIRGWRAVSAAGLRGQGLHRRSVFSQTPVSGRGDDKVGNPHRAQICQFEFFELIFIDSSNSSLSSYRN